MQEPVHFTSLLLDADHRTSSPVFRPIHRRISNLTA